MSTESASSGLWLLIDFEATCSDDDSVPRTQMEIIEFGCVMLDGATFTVIDEFESFVQPVRHPVLTPFCTALTSIMQQDVDAAPPFADVHRSFKAWLYQYRGFTFGSWGDYDRNQLAQDCEFHRLPNAVSARHVNLKEAFRLNQGLAKRPGLAQAVAMAGLGFEGTHHRGIDDARNIARLMPYVLGKRAITSSLRAASWERRHPRS